MFNNRYKFIFPGVLAGYSFLNIYLLDGDRIYQAELPALSLFFVILGISYLVWFANWSIEKYLSTKNTSLHPLLSQFLWSLITVLLISLLSVWTTGQILGGPYSYSWPNFLLTAAFASRINLFLNCLNAIYFFSKRYQEKAMETEKLHNLNMAARLESVNSQINPHFFFNNLSALSVLIHENVDLADEYLQKLSNIYRYILKNKNVELTRLRDELEFLQDYIDLLAIRFQNALSFELDLEDDCLEHCIPPAVLQLLVENVVKHNYFTHAEPLVVQIKSDCQVLSIFNRKQSKKAVAYSTGIGLKNISERYKFLGEGISIIDTEDFFKVTLPLIKTYEDPHRRRRTTGHSQD